MTGVEIPGSLGAPGGSRAVLRAPTFPARGKEISEISEISTSLLDSISCQWKLLNYKMRSKGPSVIGRPAAAGRSRVVIDTGSVTRARRRALPVRRHLAPDFRARAGARLLDAPQRVQRRRRQLPAAAAAPRDGRQEPVQELLEGRAAQLRQRREHGQREAAHVRVRVGQRGPERAREPRQERRHLCGDQPVRRVLERRGTGIATPSSRRRVDDVEVDAAIQRERAVKFRFPHRPAPAPARGARRGA